MAELLKGMKLVLKDGSEVAAEEHLAGKVVALYFSAGWCPPCRVFTPKLKRFYEAVLAAEKPLEVVWVSRDRSAEDLVDYFQEHHGAWSYLPFGSEKIPELLEKYEVPTIPAMRVITAEGRVVVKDARNEVAERGADDPLELFEEWQAFHDIPE